MVMTPSTYAPIFARIAMPAALMAGWRRVKRNGGGPGGDGQTVWQFSRGLDQNIARLVRELEVGTYHPGPLRHIALAKPDGGVRALAVPPVRDRVVQSAAVQVIAPMLEAAMSAASFAYRSGLSVERAIALVTYYRLRGFNWLVDGDIADFFPSLLHQPVLTVLCREVPCTRTCDLIACWLRSFARNGMGLAQGSPLSPLLSNLALSSVDKAIETKKVRLVRYGDDFLLMTRTRDQAQAAAEQMAALLRPLGLALHPQKTRVAHFNEGIDYLGYHFAQDRLVRASGILTPTKLPQSG